MADYIQRICDPLKIESVIDIGTGLKGPIAQHYWENIQKIKQGYCCDIWKIKPAPALWKPLNMDALKLLDVLEPKSVDCVQACGFLEHLTLKDAITFLFGVAEKIARKVVFLSCATRCHGNTNVGYDPDYKVKLDNNPYHAYKTIWSDDQLRCWGYKTNMEDIRSGRFALIGEIEAWKVFASG